MMQLYGGKNIATIKHYDGQLHLRFASDLCG